MKPCVWLVDMGYVVKAATKAHLKLDYLAGRELLARSFGQVEAHLFNGYDDALGIAPGLQGFYDAMSAQGMKVHLHPMAGAAASGDHRQKRVDVDIAAHIVWLSARPSTTVVVVTTGDQDFLPAIHIARSEYDVRLVLFTYGTAVHRELRDAAAEQILIEDHAPELAR